MTEEALVATVPAASPQAATADRPADHAAIDRLASSLVPELISRLAATGLGEIEIHEGDWKVRVRRPAPPPRRGTDGGSATGRRSGGHAVPGRFQPGHAGHGQAASDGASGNGSLTPADEPESVVVRSPAVGVFQPGKQQTGARVRAGDRIGAVDMLGVLQDVLATADGVLAESFVEPGEAVEYGQELLRIEPSGGSR